MRIHNNDGSYDDVYWDPVLKTTYGFHYPKRNHNIRINLKEYSDNVVKETKLIMKIDYSK